MNFSLRGWGHAALAQASWGEEKSRIHLWRNLDHWKVQVYPRPGGAGLVVPKLPGGALKMQIGAGSQGGRFSV